jgi:exopolysaccharide production protein ExoZ
MTGKLHGIQALRAVAALAVVAFHAAERSGGHFAIGAAGVDVFFVVSGFIMWVITHDRPVRPAGFLRERLQRIVPVYWIATGVMVTGGLLGLFPNLKLTLDHVAASLFFVPYRSPSDGQVWPVLVQGWTLNYEIFFYLVFAGTLLLPERWRLPVLGAIFVMLALVGAIVESTNPLVLTYTNPIILEFLLGAMVGKLRLSGRTPSAGIGLALIALALAGFAFVGITYLGFGPLVLGPLSALLVLGVLTLEKTGVLGGAKALTYLGDSSYSIYLWHTLAISVVAKLAGWLEASPALTFVAALLAGTVVGIAAYELLERPIAAFFKRRNRGIRQERAAFA